MNEDHEHTDLGVSNKERFGDMVQPIAPAGDDASKKVYPSFRYEGPKELHLPEEGKMEIHFCKTSETSRVKSDGSHWYECTVEVKCFGNVEGEEGEEDETPGTDAEKALDTLARALGKERSEDY
jgi:hypothetical protein